MTASLLLLVLLSASPREIPTAPSEPKARAAAEVRPPSSFALTPKLGFATSPGGLGTSVFLGAELLIFMSEKQRDLAVALEASYSGPSLKGQLQDASLTSNRLDYALDTNLLTLAALVHYSYRLRPVAGLSLHGAAGPQLTRIWASESVGFGGTAATTPAGSEAATRLGLTVLAGASYRLGPGELLGELHVSYLPVSFRTSGEVSAGGVGLLAGYRFSL